jgi:hypothetical protein
VPILSISNEVTLLKGKIALDKAFKSTRLGGSLEHVSTNTRAVALDLSRIATISKGTSGCITLFTGLGKAYIWVTPQNQQPLFISVSKTKTPKLPTAGIHLQIEATFIK